MGTKCHGQNVMGTISERTKCRGLGLGLELRLPGIFCALTFCPLTFCLSTSVRSCRSAILRHTHHSTTYTAGLEWRCIQNSQQSLLSSKSVNSICDIHHYQYHSQTFIKSFPPLLKAHRQTPLKVTPVRICSTLVNGFQYIPAPLYVTRLYIFFHAYNPIYSKHICHRSYTTTYYS